MSDVQAENWEEWTVPPVARISLLTTGCDDTGLVNRMVESKGFLDFAVGNVKSCTLQNASVPWKVAHAIDWKYVPDGLVDVYPEDVLPQYQECLRNSATAPADRQSNLDQMLAIHKGEICTIEGNSSTEAAIKAAIEELKKVIEQGHMEQQEYHSHLISIVAEQRKKQIPSVMLIIPDQTSAANFIGRVTNWVHGKVQDRLLLIMQCEMRVAEGRLHSCPHGVLWHRPMPKDPSHQPYGYKFSQPKEYIKKLKEVLRIVTTAVKVCIPRPRYRPLFLFAHLHLFIASFRCWVLQRVCSALTSLLWLKKCVISQTSWAARFWNNSTTAPQGFELPLSRLLTV
jgi:hypothetical protein